MIYTVTNQDIILEWANKRNISVETNFFQLLTQLSLQYSDIDLTADFRVLIFRSSDLSRKKSFYFPEFRAEIFDNSLQITFYSEITRVNISINLIESLNSTKVPDNWEFAYSDLFKSLININAERIARTASDSE